MKEQSLRYVLIESKAIERKLLFIDGNLHRIKKELRKVLEGKK